MLRKLKAVLGTSGLGGVLGGVFGSAMLGFAATGGGMAITTFAAGVLVSVGVGALLGGGFGTLLAMSKAGSLDEIGVGRSALLGGLGGAALPVLAAVFTGGWLVPLVVPQIALLSAVFGSAGAVVAGGLVAVAKDAEEASLPPAEGPALLEDGG